MKRATRVGQPWSVQVEMVEGCTRICGFCGIQGIREAPGNFKYLSLDLAQKVAADAAALCPNARYEFAMHGEPLVHPKANEIISIFRAALPKAQLQVTTNGSSFMHGRMAKRLQALWEAGLDYVILDTYYPERDELRAAAFALPTNLATVKDFYDDLAPKGWSPWHNHRRKVQRWVVLMDDIGARNGEVKSRTIFNHAQNAPYKTPLAQPLAKTCTIPFRELSITWNGNVNLCCMDWGNEYVCGNAQHQSLTDIWFSPPFEAARKVLYQRNRGFSPCSRCDVGSGSRVGLLPSYPTPTPADLATLHRTVTAATATNHRPPVLGGDLIPLSEIA
jgi:radical SAM protein with 4Fe4S-binding SPASM domain